MCLFPPKDTKVNVLRACQTFLAFVLFFVTINSNKYGSHKTRTKGDHIFALAPSYRGKFRSLHLSHRTIPRRRGSCIELKDDRNPTFVQVNLQILKGKPMKTSCKIFWTNILGKAINIIQSRGRKENMRWRRSNKAIECSSRKVPAYMVCANDRYNSIDSLRRSRVDKRSSNIMSTKDVAQLKTYRGVLKSAYLLLSILLYLTKYFVKIF